MQLYAIFWLLMVVIVLDLPSLSATAKRSHVIIHRDPPNRDHAPTVNFEVEDKGTEEAQRIHRTLQAREPSFFPPDELRALQALYQSTKGASWVWYGTGSRWNFDSPNTVSRNPCYEGWEGLICTCSNVSSPSTIYQEFYPYYQFYDDPRLNSTNAQKNCSVQKLFLNRHNLQGSLPSEIGLLLNMTHIHLRQNGITGSFPNSFTALSKLQVLSMWHNNMESLLPTGFSSLTALRVLTLGDNKFYGGLPHEWSALVKLQQLDAFSNSLSSTLPPSYSSLTQLQFIDLSSNTLKGSLPSTWSKLVNANSIQLSSNKLTSTFPSTWTTLSRLQRLVLSCNFLEGSLLPTISAFVNMAFISFDNNDITGSIPEELSVLTKLEYLYLNSNSLRGSIPTSLGLLTNLLELHIYENDLSKSIPTQIGNMKSLEVLLLSYNFLTGLVPPSLFQLPDLTNVSLSVNCLAIQSFKTSNLCAARSLRSLLLDGIHSAPECGNRLLLPRSSVLGGTYSIFQANVNDRPSAISMPLCLLSLPQLSILHMSGAGLVGNFSSVDDAPLSPHLKDLILASNYLTGNIPLQIQRRSTWSRLDLSLNLLTGTLVPEMTFQPGAVINLANNEISGAIPNGLFPLTSISILEGNGFSCPLFNHTIKFPMHDPHELEYTCESNNFILSSLVWCCMLVISLLSYYVLFRYGALHDIGEILESIANTLPCFIVRPKIKTATFIVDTLEQLLHCIRMSIIQMTAVVCIIMLMYGLFSLYSSGVSVRNAYTVSAINTQGIVPAVIYSISYLVVVLGSFKLFQSSLIRAIRPHASNIRDAAIDYVRDEQMTWREHIQTNLTWCLSYHGLRKGIRFAVIILLDIAVVSVANGLYVLAFFSSSSSTIRLVSFLLSVFKFLWSQFGVYYLLYIKSWSLAGSMGLPDIQIYTFLDVINTVIIPSLSILLVSPKCARFVFRAPPDLTSSVSFCAFYKIEIINGVLSKGPCSQVAAIDSSYTPPFFYSYSCSESLLKGYASVFVYSFALVAFVNPLFVTSLTALTRNLPRPTASKPMQPPIRSKGIELASISIKNPVAFDPEPNQTLSVDHNSSPTQINDTEQRLPIPNLVQKSISVTLTSIFWLEDYLTVFRAEDLVVQTNQVLSICLTFGLVYPPLCLLGCAALVIHCIFVQSTVRRRLLPSSAPMISIDPKAPGLETKPTNYEESIQGSMKMLRDEIDIFPTAVLNCLWTPFVCSYAFLAFFAFEIVGIEFPYRPGFTIILPSMFLVLAAISWQVLKSENAWNACKERFKCFCGLVSRI